MQNRKTQYDIATELYEVETQYGMFSYCADGTVPTLSVR